MTSSSLVPGADTTRQFGRRQPIGAGHVMLAVILALGAGLRLWGVRFGLPHDLARPDEEKIIGAALGIVQGDPNPHMFLYPSLFIYANAAAYWLLFILERAMGTIANRAEFLAAAAADPAVFHSSAARWGVSLAWRRLASCTRAGASCFPGG